MPDPFDRLLERTMKAGARTAEPCPPADTLAAFVDGSLSAAERAAIERHAADCQLCAEHLALLSSLEPVSSSDLSMSQTHVVAILDVAGTSRRKCRGRGGVGVAATRSAGADR